MSYPGYPPQPGGQAGSYPPPSAPQYQTTPLAYPVYPGASAPQPGFPSYSSFPAPNLGMAYPASNPVAPYPASNPGAPYPPSSTGAPYPSSNTGTPYPGSNTGAPYPGSNTGAPYPGSNTGAPYPGSNTGAPYPGSNTGAPYPGSNTGSPYPASNTGGHYPASNSGAAYPASITGVTYPASNLGAPYPASSSPYPGHASDVGAKSYPGQNYSTSLYPGGSTANPSQYSSASMPATTGHSAGVWPSSAPLTHQTSSSHSSSKTPTPTLRPANPFNPRSDAELLRKAMKGFGTDEKTLIEVLTKRCNAQRQQIAIEFKTLYGKDLVSDLMSETSGKFEDVLVALMTPIPDFLAKELNYAISGIGTKEETLVEIICTASNHEMKCIKSAYERLYGKSLEQDLSGDTSGNFRRLLVSLCQANRNENFGVDPNSAFQDAQALMRAGELRLGTDESTFNAILCSRSYPQLAAAFYEYQRLTGNDFESAVKSEFSGDIEAGLLAIVRSVRDKSEFFADQLQASMAGAGTHDRALIRIIATRCELDLGDIKNAYQRKYGRMLSEAIHDDTSGDYKRALLSLIA